MKGLRMNIEAIINKKFTSNGSELPFTVSDMISWLGLNSREKDMRVFYSNFIVHKALSGFVTAKQGKDKFITSEGLSVSVTSLTPILIDISESATPFESGMEELKQSVHSSTFESEKLEEDLYIFCKLQSAKNPTELSNWNFYLTEAITLHNFLAQQKRIDHKNIPQLVTLKSDFENLRSSVYSVAGALQV